MTGILQGNYLIDHDSRCILSVDLFIVDQFRVPDKINLTHGELQHFRSISGIV